MTGRRAGPLLLIGVILGGAACGSSRQAATSSGTSTSAPDSMTSAFIGSTSATSAPGSPATLVGLRHGAQPGAERLVFDFRGGPPGYDVHYVGGHGVTKPSGQEATVGGDAALEVRFKPAMAHDQQGVPTVTPQPVKITEGSVV